MKVGIHQPQFLPWLGYFDKIHQSDIFILLDTVQFKKNEWQNRNRIRTANGPQWLTVPVLHSFGQKISQVRIDPKSNWQRKHLRAIEVNYQKAPYFEKYFHFLKQAYLEPCVNLSELNCRLIRKIAVLLDIKTPLVLASTLEASEDPTQRLVDLCKAVEGKTYISGPDGPNYMDLELFRQSGLQLQVQQFSHPQYRQGGAGSGKEFVSHLCVLDLLMNCGDESLSILKSNNLLVI